MLEEIDEFLNKIYTKEDLFFLLQEIDFAHSFLSKTSLDKNLSSLKEKISPDLFLAINSIQKEAKKQLKNQLLQRKEEVLKKESEIRERLNEILKREEEIEKELKELEKMEENFKGTEKEKEIEQKRWGLEEERIKIEKEKWEIREQIKKIQEKSKESEKIEINPRPALFFLEQLRKSLLSLPIASLETALELDRETIQKISQWFSQNLNKKIILEVKINPKIVGGIILEYGGKIWDGSLRKKIKEEIKK